MSSIKDLRVIYEALNEEQTFSKGDTVAGTVTFTLTKDTKVKSLWVKLKGDANVRWSVGSGDNKKTYSAHRRYFKVKKYLVGEKGMALHKGLHHFKFWLNIPHGDMPPSFKGQHGEIVYQLEAKISKSWRWPSKTHQELNFVSKSLSHCDQVMCPQSGSVDKAVGVFSKGLVKMTATVNRMVFCPGDTLTVVATVCNSSSKKMKPKFSFIQKIVYQADDSTNTSETILCKMVGENITPNRTEAVSCHMMIPSDVIHSLLNCEIISVQHYIKVYLDISFAFDPEVRLPLFIVPSLSAILPPGEDFGPYPAPGAYGYAAPGPTQPGDTASGYNYQWPQQAPPCSFPATAFPPPSVQHQGPTPSLLDPPAYTSLYPPVPDTFGNALVKKN